MSDRDRKLDPVSQDYLDAEAGSFETGDVLDNKVAFSFLVARGSWEGDPLLGHRFDELANATDTQGNRNRLRDLVLDAVKWLIDSGEIAKATAQVEQITPGKVAFQLDWYRPGKPQQRNSQAFFVPVGAF